MQNSVNDAIMIAIEVIAASLIIAIFVTQLNLYKGVVNVHNDEVENQQLQEMYVKYNKYDNTTLSDYEVISLILSEVPYEADYFYVTYDTGSGTPKVINSLNAGYDNAANVRSKLNLAYNTTYSASLIVDDNGEINGVRVVKNS